MGVRCGVCARVCVYARVCARARAYRRIVRAGLARRLRPHVAVDRPPVRKCACVRAGACVWVRAWVRVSVCVCGCLCAVCVLCVGLCGRA